MAHEQKFFYLAVRESNASFRDGPEELASILLMGMIGQCARSRDEFLRNADSFLDNFGDDAEIAIEGIIEKQQQKEVDEDSWLSLKWDRHDEVIECIRKMVTEIVNVDRSKFAQIAEADWDERHEAVVDRS